MDFQLSEEQRLMRETVREFANKEILPHWRELRQKGFQGRPELIFKKMVEAGFSGAIIPAKYGGSEMDMISFAIFTEEICSTDGAAGLPIGATLSLVAKPIINFGTEEQKSKWLPKIANGSVIGAYAQTEPEAGSDVAAIKTKAVVESDHLIINGTKQFITNGSIASLVLALVRTDDSVAPHHGLTLVLIDAQKARAEGSLVILKDEDKGGIHSSPTSMMAFENCCIPVANILGGFGMGFKIAMATLTASRVVIAAQSIGLAQAAFDLALAHTKERKQFGKAICEFEMIQADLAEMAIMIDAARLLTYRAAWMVDTMSVFQTKEFMGPASMAKFYASEIAFEIAQRSALLHGGMGYMKESRIHAILEDASVLRTYEGTSNIQKLVIARSVLSRNEL